MSVSLASVLLFNLLFLLPTLKLTKSFGVDELLAGKIEPDPAHLRYLRTESAAGYRFADSLRVEEPIASGPRTVSEGR